MTAERPASRRLDLDAEADASSSYALPCRQQYAQCPASGCDVWIFAFTTHELRRGVFNHTRTEHGW